MINNLFQKSFKNFSSATKAKIKFLGKRSRSLLLHDLNHINNNSTSSNKITNDTHVSKPISNTFINSTLNKYRSLITLEEMEIINNGGPLNFTDWNKIKLKKKIKI
jgi:hypothetical protein